MAEETATDKAFSAAFNKLNDLYGDDRRLEYFDGARRLFDNDVLPRYHRIKTLTLLGSMVEWREVIACYERVFGA